MTWKCLGAPWLSLTSCTRFCKPGALQSRWQRGRCCLLPLVLHGQMQGLGCSWNCVMCCCDLRLEVTALGTFCCSEAGLLLLPVPSSCSGPWSVALGFAFSIIPFHLGVLKWLLAFICTVIYTSYLDKSACQ